MTDEIQLSKTERRRDFRGLQYLFYGEPNGTKLSPAGIRMFHLTYQSLRVKCPKCDEDWLVTAQDAVADSRWRHALKKELDAHSRMHGAERWKLRKKFARDGMYLEPQVNEADPATIEQAKEYAKLNKNTKRTNGD